MKSIVIVKIEFPYHEISNRPLFGKKTNDFEKILESNDENFHRPLIFYKKNPGRVVNYIINQGEKVITLWQVVDVTMLTVPGEDEGFIKSNNFSCMASSIALIFAQQTLHIRS